MFHEQNSIADPRDLRIQELIDTIEQQTSRIEELEDKRKQLQALLETDESTYSKASRFDPSRSVCLNECFTPSGRSVLPERISNCQ
jgi:hypothetical protein